MPRPSAARWKWPSMPPLWPTKARPGFEPSPKRSASRANSMCSIMPSTLLVTPRQFGPTMARPPSRAVLAISSCSSCSPTSAKPAANTIAEPTLRFTQASTASRTPAAGSVKTARSTPSGSSSGALQHRPAVDRLVAAADEMDVALELVQLERLQDDLAGAAGRADMPMIATERGRRNLATAFGPRAASGPVISHPCPAGTSAGARRCRADASTASPSCRSSAPRPCSGPCRR